VGGEPVWLRLSPSMGISMTNARVHVLRAHSIRETRRKVDLKMFWQGQAFDVLNMRIRELELENESLRLRPPGVGGEDYEASHQDFSQHC